MRIPGMIVPFGALACALLPALALGDTPGGDQPIEFERDILPILKESCYRCHGPHAKRIRSGLMFAGREYLLEGGDSGPAVVPGDSHSLLLRMLRYESEDFEMPPRGPLEPAQVALIERWVMEGLVWPGGENPPIDSRGIDLQHGRQWWAFQPVVRPPVPELQAPVVAGEVENSIDHFILALLAEADLEPAPRLADALLVRRAYVDLLGVPPQLEELEAYLQDKGDDRWQRLIDGLLARPEYGERWGRYWLDVVRFAQTHGYERDEEKPFIWRYRDYVIRAFNQDKPYDQFLREQLAGDELEEVTQDSLIATGFYALGVWDTEPNDPEQAIWDMQDDILRTISEGMLGVTVGCARCHDHRFDPVRQSDYYSLLAFVRNVTPYTEPQFSFTSKVYRASDESQPAREAWDAQRLIRKEQLTKQRDELYGGHLLGYIKRNLASLTVDKPDFELAQFTPQEAADELGVADYKLRQSLPMGQRIELYLLEDELRKLEESFVGSVDWALCVSESSSQPVETHVLKRGKVSSPMALVSAAFLPVMCPDDESARPSFEPRAEGTNHASSGQRRALAAWIASSSNPTTARVMVNRIWQGHFGQGLVATPNDFGATGSKPSHPLLLDWLADEFVARGWSLKEMHRLIMNSAAYCRSSSAENPAAQAADPDNTLVWRQNIRRLDAESLHDSILSAGGQLNLERGGRGYFPSLSLEAMGGASRPGSGWAVSPLEERNRRAVYAYVKRGMPVPLFMVFDAVDPTASQGKRASTNVASQALTLLNGEFTNRVSLGMARDMLEQFGPDPERLERKLYERVMLRQPSPQEQEIAQAFLEQQVAGFRALKPRATFRMAVPGRVEVSYLESLTGADCFDGPSEGWEYHKGEWGNFYNLTLGPIRDSGPYAFLKEHAFMNGRVKLDVTLDKGCTHLGIRLRGRAEGTVFWGIQLVFDVAEGHVRLLRHVGGTVQELKRAPARLRLGERHSVGIQVFRGALQVLLDGELCLDYQESALPLRPGMVGLSTGGSAIHLHALSIITGGSQFDIDLGDPKRPIERALALFCLTAFNLNEFLYVE